MAKKKDESLLQTLEDLRDHAFEMSNEAKKDHPWTQVWEGLKYAAGALRNIEAKAAKAAPPVPPGTGYPPLGEPVGG